MQAVEISAGLSLSVVHMKRSFCSVLHPTPQALRQEATNPNQALWTCGFGFPALALEVSKTAGRREASKSLVTTASMPMLFSGQEDQRSEPQAPFRPLKGPQNFCLQSLRPMAMAVVSVDSERSDRSSPLSRRRNWSLSALRRLGNKEVGTISNKSPPL